jgi:serine/threonine protein kinase
LIQVGSVVGKYVVRAKVGEGAMGTVYLGQHQALETRVAIKVIRRDVRQTEEDVSRFFTEARAASKIGHENIVSVYDVGRTDDGDPYYIMELLTGESLAQRIARGRRPLEEVRHVAAQIAGALAASHQKGIVHRDLKPANILLIKRGDDASFVKVVDFGVAKLTDEHEATGHRTQTGRLLGTPHYMAPEQVAGRRAVDGRADVYALGVMLFEMVCGRLPFDAPKWTEVLIQHVTQDPPRARERAPDCPAWLERVIDRALRKTPSERPRMSAMRDALRLADDGAADAAPPDETTSPGRLPTDAPPAPPHDTEPNASNAETVVEAKPPSSPDPGSGRKNAIADVLAKAETIASDEPSARAEAHKRRTARDRRRVIGAVAVGLGLGALALFAGALLLGAGSGKPPSRKIVASEPPPPDAGVSGAELHRRAMLVRMRRTVMHAEPPDPADFDFADSTGDAGPRRRRRPDAGPVDLTVPDASTVDAAPAQALDAYDIHEGLVATFAPVRYCRDRYEPDLKKLDVTIVVSHDGSIKRVDLPARERSTPLELCVTRAVREEARFPMILAAEQRVLYSYEWAEDH